MTYPELSEELIKAIQEGKLVNFIAKLNNVLTRNPKHYYAWLFVARAYDALGDVNNAKNSYIHLLRIALKNHPNTLLLLKEIRDFVLRYNHFDIVATAENYFGVDCLHLPISMKATTSDIIGSFSGDANSDRSKKPEDYLVERVLPNHFEFEKITNGSSEEDQEERKLLNDANKAFQKGNLANALKLFLEAINLNNRNSQTLLMIAQTLQRLKNYDEAHFYLDKGIKISQQEELQALLNLKAQVYSSQKQWVRAIETYEKLIKQEKRPAVRRFSLMQLARIYRNTDELEKAKLVLESILKENPNDQVTMRMRSALDKHLTIRDGVIEAGTSDHLELEVDLPDEGIDLISPMLRRDIEAAEFRDEKILLKGGRPEVEDADRLLDEAEATETSEFGERFPAFLEAAKAYSELSEGAYDLERFYRALARYAMLKGGALVSEFRRRIFSGKIDLDELCRLRDSAYSYYLESLALQVRVDYRYALVPLTNLLRIQMAITLKKIGESLPDNLFKENFSDLFRKCHDHKNDEIAKVAYESVIALGAASSEVWNKLQQLKGGPSILAGLLYEIKSRHRPYVIFSSIIGDAINAEQKPGEVLKKVFKYRRSMSQQLLESFNKLQETFLRTENLDPIRVKIQQLPHQGILLDTDREILDGVSATLSTLLPYQTRSQEERTGILFRVRTNIEDILKIIQQHPTYWGRVGFEPLLNRWHAAIRSIEQKRLSEIQPRLTARLEPPVFYRKEDFVEGGMILQNVGRGTAEGAVLKVALLTIDGRNVLQNNDQCLREEIAVNGTCYVQLRFPIACMSQGEHSPYQINMKIAPIFRGNNLDYEDHGFTLEVSSGEGFSIEDIPWNEIEIPPKHLFKGREQFIEELINHLENSERNKTYILFGLTRTGKTSILNYLTERVDLKPLLIKKEPFRFISFKWDLAIANSQSNAKDMWLYFIKETIISKLQKLVKANKLKGEDLPFLRNEENIRYRDWKPILEHLHKHNLYPVFIVDEFSYYRNLVDSKRLDASFLASIRHFAIGGMASFVFAGTYDLRKLIKDPAYGITGQLVNAIETRVSRIEQKAAIELIQAMGPRLQFTEDAVDHILRMSYRIPYFIQLLCKNCAKFAHKLGRSILGFPEVETVIKALSGEMEAVEFSGIYPMAAGVFMNNMQTPTDPSEYSALISTICYLTKDNLRSRMVTYAEIQAFWDRHKVTYFQARLASAIREFLDREVLVEGEDEGVPAYQISVDLFRRWWTNDHKNITLELDSVKQEG